MLKKVRVKSPKPMVFIGDHRLITVKFVDKQRDIVLEELLEKLRVFSKIYRTSGLFIFVLAKIDRRQPGQVECPDCRDQ